MDATNDVSEASFLSILPSSVKTNNSKSEDSFTKMDFSLTQDRQPSRSLIGLNRKHNVAIHRPVAINLSNNFAGIVSFDDLYKIYYLKVVIFKE